MNRIPVHPGEILKEELEELDFTAAKLAGIIDVPVNQITKIVRGKKSISAETFLRIAHYFGTSPDFWLNLQKIYELDKAKQELGDKLSRIPQRSVQIYEHVEV